ncbi:MAG: hypothetical protein WBM86_07010 [Waterburya sp.]
MTVEAWTTIFVIISFIVYLYIGWRSRVRDSKGFFVADRGVPAIANGAATAADWMSAASFISMAGLISFLGYVCQPGFLVFLPRALAQWGCFSIFLLPILFLDSPPHHH